MPPKHEYRATTTTEAASTDSELLARLEAEQRTGLHKYTLSNGYLSLWTEFVMTFQHPYAVTLTFPYEVNSRQAAAKVKRFIHLASKRFHGRRYTRFGKRLPNVFALEGCFYDGHTIRIHSHGVLDKPPHIDTREFFLILSGIWLTIVHRQGSRGQRRLVYDEALEDWELQMPKKNSLVTIKLAWNEWTYCTKGFYPVSADGLETSKSF